MSIRPRLHRFMIAAIAAAIAAILAVDYWHRQTAERVRKVEAEVQQAVKRAAALRQKEAVVAPKQQFLDRLQAGWFQPGAGPAPAQLVLALEAARQGAGVTMARVTVSASPHPTHTWYSASTTVTGPVAHVLQFVRLIETGPHTARVDQVNWDVAAAPAVQAALPWAPPGAPGAPAAAVPPAVAPGPGRAALRLTVSYLGPPPPKPGRSPAAAAAAAP